MAKKSVVILGAGYAGLLIAKKLAKKIKKQKIEDVDVTIIDKNPFHTMLTELHEVAAGRVDESSIRIDLKKIFEGRDVNVVLDTIVDADYDNKRLTGKAGTYNYDYLVMASGCKTTYFGVKGAAEHAFPLWSYHETINLRDHIQNMFISASSETDPERRKAMLTFYVVGAGFTGVEMVGELAEYVPVLCEKFYIKKEEVRIFNVDILDKIMTFLPDKGRERSMNRLAKMGVEVLLKTNVTGITKDSINLVFDGVERTDVTNTVIWTAGIEGSDIALKSEALGHEPRTRGRIKTDKHQRSLAHPSVYVAGDNVFYIPEGETESVPQMVANCEYSAPVIVENILTEIGGGQPTIEYKPTFRGAMVCIGGRYGTAYVGNPGKMKLLPSFIAMLAKHFINCLYFMLVAGFNKVASYIAHEFFTIKNRRSFLGGHFSNSGPLFLLFPLRVYLGIHFIYSAYVRIATGFLETPVLRDMFTRIANSFRPSAPMPFTDINILDQVHFRIFIETDQMHLWLKTTPVSWFLETFVVNSPSNELFWQWCIVLFELLLAGAFIAGLFTTLASIGAILGMGVVILTIGLIKHHWWIIFGSVACMFLGSKTLSLDYYVMPKLKAWWKKRRFAKKWYLFID